VGEVRGEEGERGRGKAIKIKEKKKEAIIPRIRRKSNIFRDPLRRRNATLKRGDRLRWVMSLKNFFFSIG
jgi:hypothetical protein